MVAPSDMSWNASSRKSTRIRTIAIVLNNHHQYPEPKAQAPEA